MSEADVAICNHPSTCVIAVDEAQGKLVGFACYEATNKDFFGPTGVHPEYRGRGIGKALLVAAMEGLRDLGYAYAIIGGAGPTEFYARSVGAIPIPDSSPRLSRHAEALKKGFGLTWENCTIKNDNGGEFGSQLCF